MGIFFILVKFHKNFILKHCIEYAIITLHLIKIFMVCRVCKIYIKII